MKRSSFCERNCTQSICERTQSSSVGRPRYLFIVQSSGYLQLGEVTVFADTPVQPFASALVKANTTCGSAHVLLGNFGDATACAAACRATEGCQFVSYGKGASAGDCLYELTSVACLDGWVQDTAYDFYLVNSDASASHVRGPSVGGSVAGLAAVTDGSSATCVSWSAHVQDPLLTVPLPAAAQSVRQVHVFALMQASYNGTRSRAEGGYMCQHWDSQLPNKHRYSPGGFTLIKSGARCRYVSCPD